MKKISFYLRSWLENSIEKALIDNLTLLKVERDIGDVLGSSIMYFMFFFSNITKYIFVLQYNQDGLKSVSK